MNNLELLDAEIKQLDAKEVSAHPEWDEVVAKLEKFRIRRDQQPGQGDRSEVNPKVWTS